MHPVFHLMVTAERGWISLSPCTAHPMPRAYHGYSDYILTDPPIGWIQLIVKARGGAAS